MMYKKVLALMLVLLSVTVIYDVRANNNWLEGWQYRKMHKIQGSTAGTVTNYQIKIIVHYGTGTDNDADVYLNTRCRCDFADVRFTDSEGNILKYWIQEKVNGDYAIFWVKIPNIPTYPETTTIYIYYGKVDAESESDGEATFLFFDDFHGIELNATKWDEDAINNIDQEVNGYFRFKDATKSGGTYWIYDGSDTGSQHQANVTLPNSFKILFTTQISDTIDNQMGEGGVAIVSDDNTIIIYASHGDWSGEAIQTRRWVIGENTVTNIGSGWTQNLDYRAVKSVDNLDKAKWMIKKSGSSVMVYDENGKVCEMSISSTVSKISLTAGAYGGRAYLDYIQVDYIAMANYINPEPTHTFWGNEEERIAEEEGEMNADLVMLIAIVISMLMVLVLGGRD